jgi:hypothetical protein
MKNVILNVAYMVTVGVVLFAWNWLCKPCNEDDVK